MQDFATIHSMMPGLRKLLMIWVATILCWISIIVAFLWQRTFNIVALGLLGNLGNELLGGNKKIDTIFDG